MTIMRNANIERDYRLDYLKAISILLVLVWHLQLFRFAVLKESSTGLILHHFLNIFYSQVSLIAVPVFYIVSIYIFYSKKQQGLSYFKSRILRIFIIFAFWTGIQFLLFFASAKSFYGSIPDFPLITTIIKGGPDLPYVFGSVFYFLSNMLLLTCFSILYLKIGSEKNRETISFTIIVAMLVYFEFQNFYKGSIPYWRPDNFIIYIPIVYLLMRYPDKFIKYKWLYLAGYIGFSLQDIMLSSSIHFLFPYGRISICCGALALFSIIHSYASAQMKFVKFLSQYSLGIFALHKYWQLVTIVFISKLFSMYSIKGVVLFGGIQFSTFWFIVGVIAIFLTLVSVLLLGFTPLKKMVS